MTSKGMSVEFKDIPARFLGSKIIQSTSGNARDAVADFLVEKSRKKEDRHGLARELFLTLSSKECQLIAHPKAGGQVLRIGLPTISSVAAMGR